MFAFNDFRTNGNGLIWEGDSAPMSTYPDGSRAIEAGGGPFPTNFYALLGEGGPDIEFGATFNSVPEPSSLAMLGCGSLLLARRRRVRAR
jgi:hypothetical protein